MELFQGAEVLKDIYKNISQNIPQAYTKGINFCLSGTHGVGKTTVICNILKKAAQKNYTCLYTSLIDVVDAIINSPPEEKYLVKKELLSVDFLAMDEFDPRHIPTNANDLFGKVLEYIFRTRNSNRLPVFLATNSPNPIEAFSGSFKDSIGSLLSKVKIIPAIGKDFRKQ